MMDWQEQQKEVATGVTDGSPKHYQDEGMCQACEWGECTTKAGCVAISNPSLKPEKEEYLSKAYRLANELRCHLSIAPAPQQRTWVGLTDEEMIEHIKEFRRRDIDEFDLIRDIEAKLKEKNT